jgi:hypothetical protein
MTKVDEHWEFIRALMLICGVDPTAREEWFFKQGWRHGAKHEVEVKV